MDQARALFDLNVWAVLRVTRAFLPLLLASPRGARLITNTSAASLPAGAAPWQGVYNASKAAATSFTENLRLELAPLGVRVINLVTGAVRSTFFDNAPRAVLPPGSLYVLAKETIERMMTGAHIAANGTDPARWAERVVKDLDQENPPHWIFRGRHASEVRIASLLPVGFLDRVMKKLSGLDVVEQKIKGQAGSGKAKQS